MMQQKYSLKEFRDLSEKELDEYLDKFYELWKNYWDNCESVLNEAPQAYGLVSEDFAQKVQLLAQQIESFRNMNTRLYNYASRKRSTRHMTREAKENVLQCYAMFSEVYKDNTTTYTDDDIGLSKVRDNNLRLWRLYLCSEIFLVVLTALCVAVLLFGISLAPQITLPIVALVATLSFAITYLSNTVKRVRMDYFCAADVCVALTKTTPQFFSQKPTGVKLQDPDIGTPVNKSPFKGNDDDDTVDYTYKPIQYGESAKQ